MDIEKAENIIDTMYQNRFKEKEEKVNDGIFKGVDISKYNEVEFTELEEASVRILREEISLKRKNKQLEKVPKIISKLEEKLDEVIKDGYKFLQNYKDGKITLEDCNTNVKIATYVRTHLEDLLDELEEVEADE